MRTRYGLIADTHGNLPGLQAALEALESEQVDSILHLGDVFQDGTDDQEWRCYRLLKANEVRQVKGHREKEVAKLADLPCSGDERREVDGLATAMSINTEMHMSHCSVIGDVEGSAPRIQTPEQFHAEIGRMGTGWMAMLRPEHPGIWHAYFLGHSHRRALAHVGADGITLEEPRLHEEYELDSEQRHLVLVGNLGLLEPGQRPSYAVYDRKSRLLRFEEC
jgi:predicted phosphodiesterase